MSGVDWNLVRERYAALLPLVRTRAELSDLIWEMHGELGTSHAYEIGGDQREPPQYRRGFLGADLTWDDERRRLSHRQDLSRRLVEPRRSIHRWPSRASTCARATSIVGDRRPRASAETLTPDELLVNTAGRDVALTIAAARRSARRVLVHALRDERMLRYRAWVEANRRYVHERTRRPRRLPAHPRHGAVGLRRSSIAAISRSSTATA